MSSDSQKQLKSIMDDKERNAKRKILDSKMRNMQIRVLLILNVNSSLYG